MSHDAVRKHFDEQAPRWGRKYSQCGSLRSRIATFAEAVSRVLARGGKVLDFGCGTGDISHCISDAGYEVIGIDLSPVMVEIANSRFAAPAAHFEVRSSSESELPFGNGSFDAVIASSVLEYAESPDRCLRELHRVCRSGGWVLATVPNMRHPIRWVEAIERRLKASRKVRDGEAFNRRQEYLSLSVNRSSATGWRQIFKNNGWTVIRVSGRTRTLVLFEAIKLGELGSVSDLRSEP